jgi:hypothetical protein
MVVRLGVIELATILIPNSVLAVLSGRDDKVVGWVPVTSKHYTVMGFPVDLLIAWESWDDSQIFVRAVQYGIVLGAPANTIDWFVSIDELRTKHTSSGPNLDLSVFS